MNNKRKLEAAKKTYQLDDDGNLWTKPKGSRPIAVDAVLVVVDGLTYRVDTEAIKEALQPTPTEPVKPRKSRSKKGNA